ncbi:SIMPL domain-containing protein [Donghicola mangrovi]|uniref:SIMPL domain-containing protein n=1 Tax=Donghicola mangrovi TaxID=2729614 RepID=A0A850Q7C1_9RHOB|nr:SIMPL domain-containing protein [Donghicola mangrovi]NVO24853.1 SIMPL domain-containing protein [Donghicola mangrovi]
MKFLGLVAGVVMMAAVPVYAQTATIQVVGTGTVVAEPDMAVITLGVSEEARDAAAAMETVSSKVAAILDALAQAGIAERDVQTQNVSVSPVWNNTSTGNNPRITGFEATNTVAVRVRVLDSLGFVIDRVLDSGANQMNGLTFQITDDSALLEQARRAAVQDAMAKAQLYADAAGVTLGSVLTLQETGNMQETARMDMAMMAAPKGAPIAKGELSQTATVSMTFAIQQAGQDTGSTPE